MALINITLSTRVGGELDRVLREVDDTESVTATVIQWLIDDHITLSVGDSISIDELEG